VKVGFTLTNIDASYVEKRGGVELFAHLGGAPARVEYRRRAIQRALGAIRGSRGRGETGSCEVGGFGLIVLQRALLAAEDLGGLLYALWGKGRMGGAA
jgi:hypothetical protein